MVLSPRWVNTELCCGYCLPSDLYTLSVPNLMLHQHLESSSRSDFSLIYVLPHNSNYILFTAEFPLSTKVLPWVTPTTNLTKNFCLHFCFFVHLFVHNYVTLSFFLFQIDTYEFAEQLRLFPALVDNASFKVSFFFSMNF